MIQDYYNLINDLGVDPDQLVEEEMCDECDGEGCVACLPDDAPETEIDYSDLPF